MELYDIVELAKIQEESLYTHGLTRNELITLLALVTARVYSKIYTTIPQVVSEAVAPVSKEPQPKAEVFTIPSKPKMVSYDPVFDPPPPFDSDKPPERTSPQRIIAEPNHACVCEACNKVAYTVNRLIKDGDKIADFIASYTPVPGVPPLSRKIEISNVDGQISCDCPQCGAHKSLYLTGRPVRG